MIFFFFRSLEYKQRFLNFDLSRSFFFQARKSQGIKLKKKKKKKKLGAI